MYRKELIYNEPERLTGNNKETNMNLLNEFLNEYPNYKHFKTLLSNGFNKLLLKLNRSRLSNRVAPRRSSHHKAQEDKPQYSFVSNDE